MSWYILVLLPLLAAQADEAEISPDLDAETSSIEEMETSVVVVAGDLEDAWLEITHLARDVPPVLVEIEPGSEEPVTLFPDLPPGPTMICFGARAYGVRCEKVYRGGAGELAAPAEVVVEPVLGLEIRGSLRQDLDPVAGARVSLVPAGLDSSRPFTMPLGLRESRVLREVASDEDGAFTIPETAPGAYFLETLLPSGRVHRTEPFVLPDRDALRRDYEVDDRLGETQDLFWDLGRIDVPTGLDVEFLVVDPAGRPIAGAAVAATQGSTPLDVASFESTSDAEGRAALHGLDVERPVRLACDKRGYEPFVEDYELLPVAVDCVLQPWALVAGEIVGPDSLAPLGAAVSIRPADGGVGQVVGVAADGFFGFDGLAAGSYELSAAAPGFRVERRTLEVDYGDVLELGTIPLLAAREVEGRVVDRETGEPLAGVDIRAIAPPGAVQSFTDTDGEFRFGIDAEEPLVIEFSTFDYAARRITLGPDELRSREPLTVELDPAGWILVAVEEEEGVPCRGCRVVVWPGGEEMWTDGLGEALSGPLAAGTHRLSRPGITHLGSTVVEHPEADLRRVRVEPGRTTTVRLSAPGPAVRVRFRSGVDGSGLDGLWSLSARSDRRSEKTYPEDDGSFPIHPESGETLELFLHTYDREAGREIAVWQADVRGDSFSEEVPIELSGSVVRGRVAGSEGPLPGAEVRLRSLTDGSFRGVVYTHADGTFRVPHVRPGVYNLYVGPRSLKFVSVGDRQEVDLGTFEIFLDPPSRPVR